jgi:hypothetical protein
MEGEEKPVSVVYDHCKAVYDEMMNQAREEAEGFVYVGHLTKLFANLGLSTPHYTSVRNHLVSMGCIEQLRRGGGNAPSRWLVKAAPDEESYRSIESMKRSTQGKTAALEQQVRDLNRRVLALEAINRNQQVQLDGLIRRVSDMHDADQEGKVCTHV